MFFITDPLCLIFIFNDAFAYVYGLEKSEGSEHSAYCIWCYANIKYEYFSRKVLYACLWCQNLCFQETEICFLNQFWYLLKSVCE